jgi:hypothetical protein
MEGLEKDTRKIKIFSHEKRLGQLVRRLVVHSP